MSRLGDDAEKEGARAGRNLGDGIQGSFDFPNLDLSGVERAASDVGDRAGRDLHDRINGQLGIPFNDFHANIDEQLRLPFPAPNIPEPDFSGIERSFADAGDIGGRDFTRNLNNEFANIKPPDAGNFAGAFGSSLALLLPVVATLIPAIAALASGLFAMGSAMLAAAPATLALGGILTGLIGTLLTGVLAFGGIGAAVKALGTQQAASGSSALASASQHRAAAQQIQAAQDGIVSANDAVVAANQRLVDANKAVQKAQENLAVTTADVSRANRDAAQNVTNAETAYADALNNEKIAQLGLVVARKNALEELLQTSFSLRDATLSEEAASLRLQDAQAKLNAVNNNTQSSARGREDALLAFNQAQLAYDEAADRKKQADEANTKAVAAGVDGTKAVVQQQTAIKNATATAETAAIKLAKAQEQQVITADSGARKIVAAQDSIAQAQQSVVAAQQAQEKAALGVTRAQQALANAQLSAADSAQKLAGGSNAVNKAFQNLSPAAAQFARYLFGIKGELKNLREAAGVELFPKLEGSINRLRSDLFPSLIPILRGTGSAIGDVSIKLTDAFTSKPFISNFSGIMKQNESTTVLLGSSIGNLTRGFFALFNAAGPLIQEFATYVEKSTAIFAANKEADQSTGALGDRLQAAGIQAKLVGAVFADFGRVLFNTGKAAVPAGDSLLVTFDNVLKKTNEFLTSVDGKNKVQQYFNDIVEPMKSVSFFLGQLGKEFLKTGADAGPGVTSAFDQFSKALPQLEKGISDFVNKVGPVLGPTLGAVVDLFQKVADSGAFAIAATTIRLAVEALTALFNIPGVGTIVITLLGVAAAFKALQAVTKFTGISYLFDVFKKGLFGPPGEAKKAPEQLLQGLKGVDTGANSVANVIGGKLNDAVSKVFGKFKDLDTRKINTAASEFDKLNGVLDKINITRLEQLEKISPTGAQDIYKALARVGDALDKIDLKNVTKIEDISPLHIQQSRSAVEDLAKSLKDVDDKSIRAVLEQATKLDRAFAGLKPQIDIEALKGDGTRAGNLFGDGLKESAGVVGHAADAVAGRVKDYLKQSSPAKLGALSEAGGSRGWGADAATLFAEGLKSGDSDVVRAAEKVAKDAAEGLHVDAKAVGKSASKSLEDGIKSGDTKGAGIRAGAKGAGGNFAGDIGGDLTSGNITSVQGAAASIASAFADTLQNTAQDLLSSAGEKVTGFFSKGVVDAADAEAPAAGEKVASKFSTTFSKIGTKLGSVATSIGGAMKGIGTSIYAALGPVGLIIIGIGLLVAAFIYAYTHSETFRNIVNAALAKVVEAFHFLVDEGGKVLTVLVGAFFSTKDAISGTLTAVSNFIGGILDTIKNTFNGALQFISSIISAYFNLYFAVVSTVFNAIWSTIAGIWEGIKGAFNAGVSFVSTVWSNLFNGLSNAVGTIFGAVKGAIDTVLSGIQTAFTNAKNGIGTAWDEIKTKVEEPIRSVIDVAYNRGVVPFWNKIAGLVGLPSLDTIPLAFAKGGFVPGYAPGVDRVNALLSPGEGVLVPEAVRGIAAAMGVSSEQAINSINARYSSRVNGPATPNDGMQRFGLGGIFKDVKHYTLDPIKNVVTGAADAVKDVFLGGLQAAANTVLNPIKDFVDKNQAPGEIGQFMTGLTDKAINGILGLLGKKDQTVNDSNPVGDAVARWAPLVSTVLAELGLDPGLVPKVLRQIKTESGGNPNATQGAIGDVNNASGDLARGLMQVIGATFRANAGPYLSLGQYNPHASIYAGLHYAMNKYGKDLSFLGQGHGYDAGGVASGIGMMAKQTLLPERVLSPRQTVAFEELVKTITGSSLASNSQSNGLTEGDRAILDAIKNMEPSKIVHQTVNPAPGMDELEIANIAARKIAWMM